MTRYEPARWPADTPRDPVCGRRQDHPGHCISAYAIRRAVDAKRFQVPTGSPAVAAVITEARERAGLSQRGLARLLGISQTTVARWERAQRDPGELGLARVTRVIEAAAQAGARRAA